jgi:hypothetical protein
MQRGLLFLICSLLLPFVFLSQEKGNGADFDLFVDEENYEILNTVDIPIPTETIENFDFGAPGQMTSSSVSAPTNSRNSRFGLINHHNICYLSAFITATFNVHSFREAVFDCEPNNATTVMVAEVYAKLQTAKSPISTELCLMPTLREDINWSFGRFEDNMEFGGRILDMLPESVKSLYSISLRTYYYLQGKNVVLKTKLVPQDFIVIMPTFSSISNAIQTRFRDNVDYVVEQKDFDEYKKVIEPFDGIKKKFATISEEFIENRPEIIVFGIGRRQFNTAFDETLMELDFEFILPGLEEGSEPVKYILQSFCYHVPGHYISYARDFTEGDGNDGVWYQYNDSKVSAVTNELDFQNMKKSADTGATLAFYVRSDRIVTRTAYREPQIPERIMRVAKLMLALEEIQERRRNIDTEEMKKQYRSPPAAAVVDNSSPKSLNSASSAATSVAVTLSPSNIVPLALAHRSNILKEEDKKRSQSLPSPTNGRFLEEFPLDADYF